MSAQRLSSQSASGSRQPGPSRSRLSARSSSATGSKVQDARSSTSKAAPPAKKEFELPAFSISRKVKVTASDLEKMKKKTIRRNAPLGEDLPCIKTLLKTIKGQNITLEAFVSLVAPSTGDQGETLRVVMNEDINSFRKLARKVYDTITQDNSDVLLNQQLQLTEYYKERKALFNQKMMRNIEQIYMYAPNFDFDRYATDKEKYLMELFPMPEELHVEPEEMEMMKHQAACHRLQWLRSEGERLRDENESLKQRLKQMTQMHRNKQSRMAQLEEQTEAKKEALEATQAEKVDTLEVLSVSLEKSIIGKERTLRLEKDRNLVEPLPAKSAQTKKGAKKKKVQRPAWNEEAAAAIDSQVVDAGKTAETRKIKSGFHFSPIKTPPSRQPQTRELSPFHYSPPKEVRHVSPEPPQQQVPPQRQQQPSRRSLAPRDSWGGFY